MTKAAITRLSDYKAKMGGAGISAQTHNEGVADKLAKDSVEVEKKNLTATEILNSSLKSLTDTIKEQIKAGGGVQGAVGNKADQVKSYKGAGGAVKERVDDFKKLFTLRGFLDKTGIVKKGSTGMLSGIADAALEKREAKQQYVKDRLNVDKNYVKGIGGGEAKATKTFEKQFEKGNEAHIKVQENNKAMAGLVERGFSAQVGRSTEAGNQAGLEADLSKKDSRFREGIATTPSGKPQVEKASKSANVVDIDKFKKEKKEQGNAVADAMSTSEDEAENGRKVDSQIELLSKIEENTRADGKSGENKDKKEEGGGFLSKLLGGPKKFIAGLIDSLMGILSSVGGMLMSGLTSAFKFLFNPKMLLKVFSKVLAPLAIVGALVNGIMDGFNAFMETGSIAEALIAGLGGILDFLTFGLIDAKVIREIVDWVSGFVDEYIIKPITEFATFLGDAFNTYIAEPISSAFETVGGLFKQYIVDPLVTLFEPVTAFFGKLKDQLMSFVEGFGIPEISFTIPIIDKKVAIGPFYPFKKDGGSSPAAASGGGEQKAGGKVEPAAGAAPAPKGTTAAEAGKAGKVEGTTSDAGTGGKKADKVAADSKEVEAGKTAPAPSNVTTIVNNSKTSNQKSTTAVSAPSPRNSDNPTNDYLRRRDF